MGLTPEDKVKNPCLEYLDSLEAGKAKGLLYHMRRDASGPNYIKGSADVWGWIGPFPAIHWECEFKAPGGELSARQEAWLKKCEAAGVVWKIVESVDEFKEWIDNLIAYARLHNKKDSRE